MCVCINTLCQFKDQRPISPSLLQELKEEKAFDKKANLNYTNMYNPSNYPATTGQKLLIAAVFLAALPCLSGQLPPYPATMPPVSTSAPTPGLDCFPYLINLSDCLTFVESGSNLTGPDPGCCSELANLVDTQPICLCQLLGNPSQVGIPVDMKRALKLPNVCNVTTPPVSLCAAVGVPIAALSPSSAQAPSPDGVTTASPSSSPSPRSRPSPSSSPSPGNELLDEPVLVPGNSAASFHSALALFSLIVMIFF